MSRRYDDGGGPAWQEIRVDLASFRQLQDVLSKEVQYNLQPSVDFLCGRFDGGARFARDDNPSSCVHAMRIRYADCLEDTADRLMSYLRESSLLIDVAAEILNRYQTVDELAAASVDDINRLFTTTATPREGKRGG